MSTDNGCYDGKAYMWFQVQSQMRLVPRAGKLGETNVHWHDAREKLGKPSDVWFVHPPDWPISKESRVSYGNQTFGQLTCHTQSKNCKNTGDR